MNLQVGLRNRCQGSMDWAFTGGLRVESVSRAGGLEAFAARFVSGITTEALAWRVEGSSLELGASFRQRSSAVTH